MRALWHLEMNTCLILLRKSSLRILWSRAIYWFYVLRNKVVTDLEIEKLFEILAKSSPQRSCQVEVNGYSDVCIRVDKNRKFEVKFKKVLSDEEKSLWRLQFPDITII